jgi:hypothetical protein
MFVQGKRQGEGTITYATSGIRASGSWSDGLLDEDTADITGE